MYIGMIRPVETTTISVQGEGLPEVHELVHAQTPEGWTVAGMSVAMSKHDTVLSCEATLARRDGVEMLEGADYADVLSKVPEGYQLLSVQPA